MLRQLGRFQATARTYCIVLAIAGSFERPGIAADLTFHESRKITLPAIGGRFVATRSEGGDLYLFQVEAGTITRISPQGQLSKEIKVSAAPEASRYQLFFNSDITADRQGNVYISAVWRPGPRQFASGVLVFDRNGGYVKTVMTTPPPVEARHVAVDSAGNLLVLGVNADYLRWSINQCLLVHKYSPAGGLLTAFSECPGQNLRIRGTSRPGPDYQALKKETDLGILWTQGDMVYHVLPASHLLRVFNSAGTLVMQSRLELPSLDGVRTQPQDPTTAEITMISRVVPLKNGRMLVEWRHTETTGNALRNARMVTVHESSGKALSKPVPPAPRTAMLFADADDNVYMLRSAGQVQELVQGRVEVK